MFTEGENVDKLTGEQQIRAIALEAAARIVAENLGKFISLGIIDKNKTYARMAVTDLASGFERYVKDGVR